MIGTFAITGCEHALKIPARLLYIAALALGTAAQLTAQSTPTVPATDPVYAFIDRLVALRLVDTLIVGQRAMSRREIARILAAARGRIGTDSGWMALRLADFADVFPTTIERAPLTQAYGIDATLVDSPPRGIETDANGAISVSVNPITSNQLGRPIANGTTGSAFIEAGAGVIRSVAAQGRARFSQLDPRGGASQGRIDVEQLYARGLWRNAALLIGRDYVFFGQGVSAGLTSSLNPPAVNQLRLSSDRPFVLPSLLRYAGPMQGTLMLGDLGKDQHYPHTRLLTYKLSARPHSRFEIGTTFAEQVGGEGSPPGTFLQKATDAIPILDATILHRRFLFSNKFMGVDMRLAVPGATGLQVYMESAFDDFDLRRLRSTLTEDAGYVWGISHSCLMQCGPVRLTGEYHVTGLRYYTHLDYYNGYTVHQQFLGDPIGPRGKGAYAILDVDRAWGAFRADVAREARSGDKYGSVTTTPDDSDFHFIRMEHLPAEIRWRTTASIRRGGLQDAVSFNLLGGVERVNHFAHSADGTRTNWLLQLGAEYRPQPRYAK